MLKISQLFSSEQYYYNRGVVSKVIRSQMQFEENKLKYCNYFMAKQMKFVKFIGFSKKKIFSDSDYYVLTKTHNTNNTTHITQNIIRVYKIKREISNLGSPELRKVFFFTKYLCICLSVCSAGEKFLDNHQVHKNISTGPIHARKGLKKF